MSGVEQIPALIVRITALENDMKDLERLWRSSVDDIKNTIKGEVSELKAEPISDLRNRVSEGYKTLKEYDERLREVENSVRDWNTGRSVVKYLVHGAVAVGSAAAGILGYEGIRGH